MSDGELSRLEVLRDLDQRRLTTEAAGQLLGLERRQVFRLLKAYRIGGTHPAAPNRIVAFSLFGVRWNRAGAGWARETRPGSSKPNAGTVCCGLSAGANRIRTPVPLATGSLLLRYGNAAGCGEDQTGQQVLG
jgi:hypothetical protein